MKIFDLEQGSNEWFEARAGIPTASMFHRIVKPGGEPRTKKDGTLYKSSAGELAEGRWSYAFELAAERLLGESKLPLDGLQWIERGKVLEPDAVAHYEFTRDRKTAKVGFITPDHGRWGCSPDRLVIGKEGDPLGALEIKSPSAPIHLEYFINGPGTNYRCQVQGSLMTTGFDFWDFSSYHPQLPDVLIRFERDEDFITKLEQGLIQFCSEVDMVCEKIKEAGYVPTPSSFAGPVDVAMKAWEGSDAIEGILRTGNFGG
jgi:hypothetical protein